MLSFFENLLLSVFKYYWQQANVPISMYQSVYRGYILWYVNYTSVKLFKCMELVLFTMSLFISLWFPLPHTVFLSYTAMSALLYTEIAIFFSISRRENAESLRNIPLVSYNSIFSHPSLFYLEMTSSKELK